MIVAIALHLTFLFLALDLALSMLVFGPHSHLLFLQETEEQSPHSSVKEFLPFHTTAKSTTQRRTILICIFLINTSTEMRSSTVLCNLGLAAIASAQTHTSFSLPLPTSSVVSMIGQMDNCMHRCELHVASRIVAIATDYSQVTLETSAVVQLVLLYPVHQEVTSTKQSHAWIYALTATVP